MSFAVVFPGQGSQSIGMLSALAEQYSVVQDTFSEASKILGMDLWSVVQNGSLDVLNRTEITQPAMLAAGVAVWRVWDEEGGCMPVMMAGHSLGEYTALVCSQAIAFHDAVDIVSHRAKWMQEAVPEGVGAMAAILGLERSYIEDICKQASTSDCYVEPANYNAPGQIVIAGHIDALEKAIKLAESDAKKIVKLPVSVPSHSRLMKPAADKMAAYLQKFTINTPTIPVYQNVDGKPHQESKKIKENLVRQIESPVLWVDTIEMFSDEGVLGIFEFGPKKVLSGLNKRIDRGLKVLGIEDPKTVRQGLDLCEEFGV